MGQTGSYSNPRPLRYIDTSTSEYTREVIRKHYKTLFCYCNQDQLFSKSDADYNYYDLQIPAKLLSRPIRISNSDTDWIQIQDGNCPEFFGLLQALLLEVIPWEHTVTRRWNPPSDCVFQYDLLLLKVAE